MIELISGTYGAGKSTYMHHKLNESAFDFERIKQGQAWLRAFNAQRGYNIPTPEHFTFCTEDVIFRRRLHHDRKNHKLEIERFGVQKEAPKDVKCQFLPKWSTLGCDELQKYFPSRDGEPVGNWQYGGFEQHRHRELNIYGTTPAFLLVDKRIRRNASGVYITDRKVIDNDKEFKVIITADKIPVGLIDYYDSLTPNEIKQNRKLFKQEITVIDYNIYDLFDTNAHCDDFDEGFEEKDCIIA